MSGYIFVGILALAGYVLATSDEFELGDVGDGNDSSGGGSGSEDPLAYDQELYEKYVAYQENSSSPWGIPIGDLLPGMSSEPLSEAEFRDKWEGLSRSEKQEFLEMIN